MELINATKSKIRVDANGGKVPFDLFLSGGLDSCYSTYKFEQDDDIEENGRDSEIFAKDFSHDELPLFYQSWARKDEPYQLMDCAQDTPKNGNLKNNIDCGSEADLYGLVSNILEEVDPMDSYFSKDRLSAGLATVWSPKSENSLQYLNSEVKVQSRSGIQHNPKHGINLYTCPMERDPDQSGDMLPYSSDYGDTGPSWYFPTCNAESKSESCTPAFTNFPRPPPGLDVSHAMRSHFSKSRPDISEHNVKDSSFHSISGKLSDSPDALNDHYCSPAKMMNDSYFSPYQDFSALSGPEIVKYNSQQFSMQDVSKLTNNLEAFHIGDQQSMYNREPSQSNALSVQDEDIFDLNGLPSQRMSAFEAYMASLNREITRKQRDAQLGTITTKEFADFAQQPDDYFEASKPFAPSFNFSSHQRKEVNQREERNLQTSLYQYHHGQPNQYQCYTKPPTRTNINTHPQGTSKFMSQSVAEFVPALSQKQMQRTVPSLFSNCGQSDKRMGHMGLGMGPNGIRKIGDAVDREEFGLQLEMGRFQTSTTDFTANAHYPPCFGVKPKSLAGLPKEAEQKKGLLQNPYQILSSSYAGQARHNGARSAPSQMFPGLYQMGVSGQNPCRMFPSRSPMAFRGSVPVVDLSELRPDAEFPPLNPQLQEMMGPNLAGVDGLFPGLFTNLRSSKQSMSQLHHYLEECYEQWRILENERKKTEDALLKSFPGKCSSVMNHNSVPKLPLNPTKVDKLIVDQFREQTKVVSLLGKMERLCSFPFHANISSKLDRHLKAIYVAQAYRKDEFLNGSRQRQGVANLREDRDIFFLASSLKDLSRSTRLSCTALWCALQMTLPKEIISTEDGERDNSLQF